MFGGQLDRIEYKIDQLAFRLRLVANAVAGLAAGSDVYKAAIHALTEDLKKSTDDLKSSVDRNQPPVLMRGDSPVATTDPNLQELVDEVAACTTVMQGAKTLIDGFAARLAAAGTDPAALKKLHDDLKAQTDALAASVQANTPAAPPAGGAAPGKKK